MFERLSRLNTRARVIMMIGAFFALFAASVFAGSASGYFGVSGDKNNIEPGTQDLTGSVKGTANDLGRTSKKSAKARAEASPEGSRTEYVTEDKKIPFDKTTVFTDDLPQGVSQIIAKGSDGLARVTYHITYRKNAPPLKEEVSRTTVTLPVTQITGFGTLINKGDGAAPVSPEPTPADPADPSSDPLPAECFDTSTSELICPPQLQ